MTYLETRVQGSEPPHGRVLENRQNGQDGSEE